MDLNTTFMLAFEDMRELLKEEHRSTMVFARKKKKETLQRQKKECRQLERELKRFVKNARTKAACDAEGDPECASTYSITKLQKSVVIWEAHSRENQVLRDEIKRQKVFEEVVRRSSRAEIDAKPLVLLPEDFRSGRRVYFEQEEPSFHFYPFSRAEFDAGMEHFEAELTKGIQAIVMIGNVLGWDIYRAPLETNGNSVLQRVQLKKRLNCPLDQILRESYMKNKYVFPLVVTPVGFSLYQRHSVSVSILQSFDETARACVCNIPGPYKHLRFMYFIRQKQRKFPDGRRRIEFSIAIADSTMNRYSRDAEEAHNVEWTTEGGIHVSLTEVNEASVDGVWTHWADCKNKIHADYMMVQWTEFANLWEQAVASQCLLN